LLVDGFDLEINSDGTDKRRSERVIRVAEQERGFAHTAVADDEKFEHVVEVLVGGILDSTRGGHLLWKLL